jgi:sugar/nucleoside kinase (ribokinase family)
MRKKGLQVFYLLIINIINMSLIHVQGKYPKLIGFGSPIVDGIVSYNSDSETGEKIKNTLKYHMSTDIPSEYYSIFKSNSTLILLGGSAMNTIRTSNFLLKFISKNFIYSQNISYFDESIVGYIGSIGKDENGIFLQKGLSKENIIFFKEEFENERTSTALILIEEKERSTYSDLGASKKVTYEHFLKHHKYFQNTKLFFADAYLIGIQFQGFKYIFKNFSMNDNITLSLGLANENIVRDYYDNIEEIFPYVDILIANQEEMDMFRNKYENKSMGLGNKNFTDIEFLEYISDSFPKVNKNKKRIIVNTRGKDDTYIYYIDYIKNKKELLRLPIFEIDKSLIVDLNGAGDSFTGGFLAGILLDYDIRDCGLLGNRIAGEVIQLNGFQIPKKLNSEEFLIDLPFLNKSIDINNDSNLYALKSQEKYDL